VFVVLIPLFVIDILLKSLEVVVLCWGLVYCYLGFGAGAKHVQNRYNSSLN
jgi:hypothetical protein